MADKTKKIYETKDFTAPFPIMPVGKSYNSRATSVTGANITSGSVTRVSPENQSEAGTLIRCMTCRYKAPMEAFMSDNKMIFKGCPECGQIDRSKMVYIDEEGITVPNESNIHLKDFSDYINKAPKNYGKPKPVEHQLRQNII